MKDVTLNLCRWQEKLENNCVRCVLCPRSCVLGQGKSGFCSVRTNRGGELISDAWGKPVAMHVDPIEKKPLYHFYPGEDVFSLGTLGCNMNCKFCQNWSISRAAYESERDSLILPEEIVARAQGSAKMIAYTYNEPIVWAEYAMDCAKLARQRGLKNVFISAGYLEDEARQEVFSLMDGVNIDLKGFSEEFYKKYTNASLAPVLDTLQYLAKCENIWLEITTLIIPNLNDSPKMLEAEFEWIANTLGPSIPLHLSAFFPNHQMNDLPATSLQTLQRAKKLAYDCGLQYVYLGNVMEAAHTLCPACGEVIVKRWGYDVDSKGILDGECRFCKRVIEGKYYSRETELDRFNGDEI